MAIKKATRRAISAQAARVSALLGGTPARKLLNKPMPLEAELKAQAKFRHKRWVERSKHTKAILAPLQKIIAADEGSMKALKALKGLRPGTIPKRTKLYSSPVRSHTRAGSILTVRAAPYDDDWTAGNRPALGDSTASKAGGGFEIWTRSSFGASVWAGAGVAVWFQPIADNTFVRFGAFVPGECSWDDNSYGYAAHNSAFIGVLIESFDLRGNNHRIEQDRRIPLWNDGTGWYEEHGNNDEFDVYFPNDTFFMATTARWYRVWTWASASCYADGGFWGTSEANAHLAFGTRFCVFEQFT